VAEKKRVKFDAYDSIYGTVFACYADAEKEYNRFAN